MKKEDITRFKKYQREVSELMTGLILNNRRVEELIDKFMEKIKDIIFGRSLLDLPQSIKLKGKFLEKYSGHEIEKNFVEKIFFK